MGMRQTLLLPQDVLEALATLFEITEGLGELPEQIQILIVKLLDKPKGGKRPVGIFPWYYRPWGVNSARRSGKMGTRRNEEVLLRGLERVRCRASCLENDVTQRGGEERG